MFVGLAESGATRISFRMGLQWLNAILGFERDRVEARMRRRRAREDEHVESVSSNDDSSSDSSSNAEAHDPPEYNGAEPPSESTNNGANHNEQGSEDSPKEATASSEVAPVPESEPMESLEEEQATAVCCYFIQQFSE